jgi:hypothetical protein
MTPLGKVAAKLRGVTKGLARAASKAVRRFMQKTPEQLKWGEQLHGNKCRIAVLGLCSNVAGRR